MKEVEMMRGWLAWRVWWRTVGLGAAPSHELDVDWLRLNGRKTSRDGCKMPGFVGAYYRCLSRALGGTDVDDKCSTRDGATFAADRSTRTIDDETLTKYLMINDDDDAYAERTIAMLSGEVGDDLSILATMPERCALELVGTGSRGCGLQDARAIRVTMRRELTAHTRLGVTSTGFMPTAYVTLTPLCAAVHWLLATRRRDRTEWSRATTYFSDEWNGEGIRVDVLVTSVVLESAVETLEPTYVRFDDTPSVLACMVDTEIDPCFPYRLPCYDTHRRRRRRRRALRLVLAVVDDEGTANRIASTPVAVIDTVRSLLLSSTVGGLGLVTFRVDPYLSNPSSLRSTIGNNVHAVAPNILRACHAAPFVAVMRPRRYFAVDDNSSSLVPMQLRGTGFCCWRLYTRQPCDEVKTVPLELTLAAQVTNSGAVITYENGALRTFGFAASISADDDVTRVISRDERVTVVRAPRVYAYDNYVFVTERPLIFVPRPTAARACRLSTTTTCLKSQDVTESRRTGCFVAALYRGSRVWFPTGSADRTNERCYDGVPHDIAPIVRWTIRHVTEGVDDDPSPGQSPHVDQDDR